MSAHVIIRCDSRDPDRTPNRCRAYLITDSAYVDPAYEQAEAAGWTQHDGLVDHCPSCSRGAS